METDHEPYVWTLSEKLAETAKRELGETPDVRTKALAEIRKRLHDRPDLLCPKDNLFLLAFLRARKFEVDRAFTLLVNWCTMRTNRKDLYGDFTAASIRDAMETGFMATLSFKDNLGRSISIYRAGTWDVEKFTLYDLIKVPLMLMDLRIRDEEVQINGVVTIIDMEGIGMHHMTHIGPRMARKIAPIINQDSIPVRVKAIHFINESRLLDVVLAMIKPFMKKKVKERIHTHAHDLSSLHAKVPAMILPCEYGGLTSSRDDLIQMVVAKALAHEEVIKEFTKYGIKKVKNSDGSVAGNGGVS
ncbi:alpha-tocopherol transfer protein-like, partial [Saccoglossus kowalevskii]|uniref:Alpha-tocopherol transfer protein-like n=1 Tax=Saccoglossus kowalevskii TaxID=10224 RepID=A0ABM0GZ33_SACKO